jgi:hypothetical protein
MEAEEQNQRRVERVQFETDRHVIVGDLTLPPEGYKSRLSDALNRSDVSFIPVTDVEVRPIEGGEGVRHDFVVVAKQHIRAAFPV